MPALEPYIIEPIWEQFRPPCPSDRPTIRSAATAHASPSRVVFEKLVQVLVFGCAYQRIADESCSESTLRRRRDEWIELGLMEQAQGDLPGGLRPPHRAGALGGGGRLLHNQGPLRRGEGGKEPGGQGKTGHQTLDGGGRQGHPAGRRERPRQPPRLAAFGPDPRGTSEALGTLPEGASVHLDRGYDSQLTRERLEELGLGWEISGKGKPAPYWATDRWVVERTNSWHNAHKKLVWCTERVGRVIDFWVAFSDVVIIVRRLIREGWSRYRWEGRPSRRP